MKSKALKRTVAGIAVATIVIAAALALFAISVKPASASHFRYGHYYSAGSGNTIDFTLQDAFRRGSYTCINPATLLGIPCTGPGGLPGVGDVIVEFIGGTTFDPGDGSGVIGSPLGPLLYQVTSIDPANDWLFGVALDPAALPMVKTTITHTYAAAGMYTAFTGSCCRISAFAPPNAHINNPDGFYRIETLVNVGSGDSSPVSGLPPIVLCPIGAMCSFAVPGLDPDGDMVNFRMSTDVEASGFAGGFIQPGPPFAPNAAGINGATGLYTWDTTGATMGPVGSNTLYSTQVTIEELDPAGGVKGKVAVDFLIQLVPVVGVPPQFDSPPTPACGVTQTVNVGGTLSFTVQASDSDAGQTVTLNVGGLPPGAVMAPPLPVAGNPVSSMFLWTPAAPGVAVVTFSATDDTGQSALCSIPIEVTAASKGSISGMKFDDLNGNGIKDMGEPGLENWEITLTMPDGSVVTTMTLADGTYTFPGLTDGTYMVGETMQAGWIQTMPPMPGTYTVVIVGGSNAIGMDFGNFKLGSVHGMKFNDMNGNGRNDNEPGLEGWEITIDGFDTITNTPVHMTAMTDANGNYWFMGLTAGTYTISETMQNGWMQTAPPMPGTYTVTIDTSGMVIEGLDFGNQRMPPEAECVETVNPAGKNIPTAGANPKSGQNPDGFYELLAKDMLDPSPVVFVKDTESGTIFGPYPSGTKIKYTEANGATPEAKPMTGAIDWHIKGKGDAAVYAMNMFGMKSGEVMCLVPPPPK